MKKVLRLCVIFAAAGLGLWLFPALSVAVSAPNEFTVLKSDGVDQVIAGDGATHTYVITVTNTGTEPVNNVDLIDTWPPGLVRGQVTAGCDTQTSPTNFDCSLGRMLAGASATITASYTVPAGATAGIYTNTVEVVGINELPVTVRETTSVVLVSELGLEKSDGVSRVAAGNGIIYTYVMTVTNIGPSVAGNVLVTDTWPANFERGLVIPSQGDCDTATSTTNFTCTLGGLDVGANAIITASYTVPAGTPLGMYTNEIQARADGGVLSSISDVNEVVIDAELGLAKSDGVGQVGAGDGITYTYVMTVSNAGPSIAGSVVVTDTWPTGFTRGTVGTSQGDCNLGDAEDFTCSLGSLGVGASATITASYSVPAGTATGTYTNTMDADPDVGQRVTVSDVNAVVVTAALSVQKDDGVSQVTAGDGITYTYVMTVSNAGPSVAGNVVVTDNWPAGFTRGVVQPGQGTCDTDTDPDDFTCAIGSLDVGASATITASYSVPAGTPAGTYTNTIDVDSDASDPVSVNDINTVVATAGLSVQKDDGVSQLTAGDGSVNTYLMTVTNDGPSVAGNVVVTDTWPAGFTRSLVQTSHGDCVLSDPEDFTCDLGDLNPAETAVLTAAYTVPADIAAGSYTNTFQADSDASTQISVNDVNTVITDASLSVQKDDGVSVVTAGDEILYTYVMTVTNGGPSVAGNVVVTDTWPAGFTRVSVVTSLGECDLSGPADFTCTINSLDANQSAVITASYTVPANTAAGSYTNTVEADSDASTPVSASDVNTVLTDASLSVQKDDGVSVVTAGDGILYTYVMTVTNDGPSVAGNVVVMDTWPAGFTRVSVVTSLGECDLSGPTDFTCTVNSLDANQSAVITASYTVPADIAAGSYTNTVEADSDVSTPVSINDTNTVLTDASLSVQKDDGVSVVTAGDEILYTYVMTVTNEGPSLASNVVVTDSWPTGFTRNLVQTNHGICSLSDPEDFTCDLGNLDPDETAVITAGYTVPADTAAGSYTNTVEADSDVSTPVSVSDVNTVLTDASLSVLKDDGVSQVTAGDGILYTYVITVTNEGPSLASNAVVTDTWPAGFTRNLVQTNHGICTLSDPEDFTCDLGNLDPDETAVITAAYTVPADTAAGGYTNTIEADSDASTPVSVSDANTVLADADISVQKDDGVSEVTAGDGILYTYVMTVTNGGPSLASNVVVADSWPAGFTRVSVVTSLGECDLSGPADFTCDMGDLAVGAIATINASYRVPAGVPAGSYANTIEADSDASAPVSVSDTNVVEASAGLGLLKSDGVSQVTAGDGLVHRYVVTLVNAGPSLASNVVVTDTWPAGFTRTSVETSQGNCALSDPEDFTCSLGSLDVDASATITASYSVAADASPGVYTNLVQAASDASATIETMDTTRVVAVAGLELQKSDGVSQVIAGSGGTYTYVIGVTNDGPSLAGGVVVTDTWPTGFTRTSVQANVGSCNLSNPANFTCSLGDLEVGSHATITATYTVPASTPGGTQTNVVQVDSDASAPISANDANMVVRHADLGLSMLDAPDPVPSGQWVTYTLSVTNAGPVGALGVVLTDTLPTGLSFDGAGSSPECGLVGGSVSCSLGDMASGASRQVLIKAYVSTSVAGIVTNHAGVGSNTTDPDESDNQIAQDTTVLDLIAPQVTWVSPVLDQQVKDVVCEYVHLVVSASDNHQVEHVWFTWYVPTGGGLWIDIANDYSPPYQKDFYTCDLQLGYNQIYAFAYDTWGNRSPGRRILLYKTSNEIITPDIYLPMIVK